jgi:AraC-like DNA-binding protein
MRGTDLTLDSIAELSGYSTGFALSKAFQRVYGISPRRLAQGVPAGKSV